MHKCREKYQHGIRIVCSHEGFGTTETNDLILGIVDKVMCQLDINKVHMSSDWVNVPR